MNQRESVWNQYRKIMNVTSQAKGIIPMAHCILAHKYATNDSGCESSSGQGMEEARNDTSLALGQSEDQKGGSSGSTKRRKESPLRYIDGHLASQKRGVRTNISEVQRKSRAPR